MSLIGPRPHALAHDNYFESILSDYAFRHHVKPGITGGHNTTEQEARRRRSNISQSV